MDLWSARLVFIHLHRHRHHPIILQQHLEIRVSVLSFLYVVLFLWRAAFCPFQSSKELLFSSPLLSKYVMRVALYLAHWLPRPLPHFSGSQTVP